jgi:outer membrane protein TolC
MDILFDGQNISFPAAFPQDTLDLAADWTLFDGFRGLQQWRAAEAESRAARLERDRAAFELGQQVAIRFTKALAALQLTEVAMQNVATLEDHLRLAQANEVSGASTHFDVLRIQAQREEALAAQVQAEDQSGLARAALAQAMGLSADARTLEGGLPAPEAESLADGDGPDLDRRGDFQALRLRQQALAARALALESAWVPDVVLFWDRQFYHYGDFNPLILETPAAGPYQAGGEGFGRSDMLGLGARWNLFGGGADLARLLDARDQAKAAAAALEAAGLQAQRDFDMWKRRYRDSARLYQARLRVLDQCRESVRLAQLGLQAGTLTNSEVLDAELDLFRARAGLVQAQADAAEARLNIELLKGDSQARQGQP